MGWTPTRIATFDKEIARRTRQDEVARRLMTIPTIGPITANAIAAIALSAETFAKGRLFGAWLGLAPKQLSDGAMDLPPSGVLLFGFLSGFAAFLSWADSPRI